MMFKGNMLKNIDIPKAIKLGIKAYFGIPFGKKLDQVKLPKL